jgi:hypothetical protein
MLWLQPEEAMPKGPPCVLDIALSLAPAGLYWTLGLAQVLPVWLPQCHWSIVDDNAFLGDEQLVLRLAGVEDFVEASAIVARVRDDWRRARDELALESVPRVYWPADGRAESVVPKDNDGTFVDRFHVLAAGLEGRGHGLAQASPGSADALADCARDTLALAVALGDRRSVVLTPLAPGSATPALADHLASAGIECRKLTDRPLMASLSAALIPALFASGLVVSLACNRLRLAGLFVAAPRALAAASLAMAVGSAEYSLELDVTADQGEAALWDDASAIWWELP